MTIQKPKTLLAIICCCIWNCTFAQTGNAILNPDIPMIEFQQRRQKAIDIYPSDLLIFPSNSRIKSDEQHGFIQNTSFYYFSGLANVVGAILVVGGPIKKSVLFVPATIGLSPEMETKALIDPTPITRDSLLLDQILPVDSFENYISNILQVSPNTKIYSDHQREGIRIQNFEIVKDEWTEKLKRRWSVSIQTPHKALALQEIKSEREIEAMSNAGSNATRALLQAIQTIKPGIHSRQVEGKIVYECLCNGGNGVYFWPLVVQGKNAAYPGFFRAFTDYRNLSEVLKAGDLVRIDVGCDFNHYKSDVGRTVPVSGKFSAEQKEVYDLLVHGYLAALQTFKDGVTLDSILLTFKKEVSKYQNSLKTAHGKTAFKHIMSDEGLVDFEVHEMGLGGTEKQVKVLKEGMVVAWEPMFTVDEQSYYLEDLIEIKKMGYVNLTSGLPYFSNEIEKRMKRKN